MHYHSRFGSFSPIALQQSGMDIAELTLFAAFSPPSAAMVGYGVVYAVVVRLLTMRSFSRRDL